MSANPAFTIVNLKPSTKKEYHERMEKIQEAQKVFFSDVEKRKK